MTQQEDYRNWAQHFGKSTVHPDLLREFQRAGVKDAPAIKRGMLHTRIGFPGLTVNFAHPIIIPTIEKVGARTGILYGIALHFSGSTPYRGWIPFGVAATDNRESLRKKLGSPDKFDNEEAWDEWSIDGYVVTAMYKDSFEALMSLSAYLPEPGAKSDGT